MNNKKTKKKTIVKIHKHNNKQNKRRGKNNDN